MSESSPIIHKEPLSNPPRKRGGCHRREGFFYYGYLAGHNITTQNCATDKFYYFVITMISS
jgi:hypothetical protein